MIKINIDEIIKSTQSKVKNLEYHKSQAKPSLQGVKIPETDFMKKYVFNNNIFVNGNVNNSKNIIIGTKGVENKGKEKGVKKNVNICLDDFYSLDNNFVKTIKITFIKEFLKQVKFCPYCGKVPLIYFGDLETCFDNKEDNNRTFELDHFFPKSTYKDIAFNFYNLIPSCKSCNHLKSTNDPWDTLKEKGKIFHPYFGWITKTGVQNVHNKFSYDSCTEISKGFQSKHSQFFKLPQIYLNSQDTFNTFKFIQDKRNKMKAEKNNYIKNSLKTDAELKNYFFKNYYPESENDILKFANGKLKKDLIAKIGNNGPTDSI